MTKKDALRKFERDSKHKYFIVTGKVHMGKTTAALTRAVFLQDNYYIRDDENILFISKENLNEALEQVQQDSKRDNTLFSFINSNSIRVLSKEGLFDQCFEEIQDILNLKYRFCHNEVARGLVLEGISELRTNIKRLDKIIISNNIDFLFDEVMYIKELNIGSLEEYQVLNRRNRGRTIRKNTRAREHIYRLYQWYCNCMCKSNLLDEIDKFRLISQNINHIKSNLYTHIVIDNVEEFTVKEVSFIRNLLKTVDYSNFILVRNSQVPLEKPWLEHFIKNKNITNIDKEKYKIINCNTLNGSTNKVKDIEVETVKSAKEKEVMNEEKIQSKFIELYKYIDFKHNVHHDFAIDTSSHDEVILNPDTTSEVIGEKEISKVPVFNEIAAGQPISINDEIEGEFNIPVYWLKGVSQPFILKIKGDSMININIEDGDYVVINKQTMANHNEIVAVSIDGEATLKRLWLKGRKAVLMPENDKYSPIEINEDNAYIIGKAVGLIKAIN